MFPRSDNGASKKKDPREKQADDLGEYPFEQTERESVAESSVEHLVPGALAVPDEDDAFGDDVADGHTVPARLGPALLLAAQRHVRDTAGVQPGLEKYPTGEGRCDRRHGEGDVRGHDGEDISQYRGPVDRGGDRRDDVHVTSVRPE
jgi:hypothetical protein